MTNKTVETDASVDAYLAGVMPPARADDARALIEIMRAISGEPPRMWGPSIIGFGTHHYRYESGREGTICQIGFAPRKAELALYVGVSDPDLADLLPRLGKHKTGKGCLYLKRLSDADPDVLAAVIRTAWERRA